MTSREKVLAHLKNRIGEFESGEAIAEELGLSRNAVWKAINGLRKEGYRIEAVTNRGYCLLEGESRMALREIETYLDPGLGPQITVFDSIESTNETAKEMALKGAPHGTVLIAERQTAGNAHHFGQFFSPAGGIYMSLILRPGNLRRTDLEDFSRTSAVGVARAIETVTGLEVRIRGINDICLGDKKVAGILNETVTNFETRDISWIVVGVGIHFCEKAEDFPKDLQNTTTSLYPTGQAGASRNQLAAEVINEFLGEKYGDTEQVEREYARLYE
jgi:BirA family biotin operon repressor/biotin-[acetyl-CoA-carboxylase] ligase